MGHLGLASYLYHVKPWASVGGGACQVAALGAGIGLPWHGGCCRHPLPLWYLRTLSVKAAENDGPRQINSTPQQQFLDFVELSFVHRDWVCNTSLLGLDPGRCYLDLISLQLQ